VYCSKPFIVARLLCCLFVDLIWRNLLYIPVERETLFRVSLARSGGIGQAHVRWNRYAWETLLSIVELERSLSRKIAPTDSAEVSHKSCKSLGTEV